MSIKEVARLAGVSPSTVSRVINSGNTSAASPETQERIWEAARQIGYIPNQNARKLRRPDSSVPMIAQRIDCIFARFVGTNVDYFFEQLMHEVRTQLLINGYQLGSICTLEDLPSLPPHSHASAALILGRINNSQMQLLQAQYKHLVSISLQDMDLPVDQVISRGYDAARTAVNHLYALGHRHICYLGEVDAEQRYEGYLDAMNAIGMTNPNPLVVDATFSPASGYDAAVELLRRQVPFTAILCANDMLALGVIKALNEHKLRVPRDVSIVGINDKEDVRYLSPMLTAVNIPIEEMGAHAAKLLLDRIAGNHQLPVKMILPNKLIVRESCGPARTIV